MATDKVGFVEKQDGCFNKELITKIQGVDTNINSSLLRETVTESGSGMKPVFSVCSK